MARIECRNLRKVYKEGVYGLDGIDFSLESGDFLAILGESGGGKTTLLRCLAGLIPITAGELYINGEISNLSSVQERKVGAVFQEITLYPNMTVFENVSFALKKQKLPFQEECNKVRSVLSKMGILSLQSALPRQLSFGQKQKVALARALVKEPDIVLFDEPLSNIDEPSRVQYREMIRDAKADWPDSTFVYVTHNVTDAVAMANKVMVLQKGKILQFCEKELLYNFPGSIECAKYLFGSCDYEDAYVRDGKLFSKNIEINFNDFQRASVALEQYEDDKLQYVSTNSFEGLFCNGKSICGVSEEYEMPCYLGKDSLRICGDLYDITELSDGILSTGEAIARLRREYISFDEHEPSIAMKTHVIYADEKYIVYDVCGRRIADYNRLGLCEDKEVTLYYPISKLRFVDKRGNLMLTSYVITKNQFTVKVLPVSGGRISLGGKSMKLATPHSGEKELEISIEMDAFYQADKRNGIPIKVINEEHAPDFTICYGYIKGQDEYITAKLPAGTRCFVSEGLYLCIDAEKVFQRRVNEDIL